MHTIIQTRATMIQQVAAVCGNTLMNAELRILNLCWLVDVTRYIVRIHESVTPHCFHDFYRYLATRVVPPLCIRVPTLQSASFAFLQLVASYGCEQFVLALSMVDSYGVMSGGSISILHFFLMSAVLREAQRE